MSKLERLLAAYRQHVSLPWQDGLAPPQRVIFCVYDKTDELRLRIQVKEFELATRQAGRGWLLLDVTDAFPEWMAAQEYRDSYFECPEDLAGYPEGELKEFLGDLVHRLRTRIAEEAGAETVVAVLGVGSLFGLARVSSLVEGLKDSVSGRLVVFFPGEHHPDTHSYRLLDARDGWNYLAVALTGDE